MRKMLKWSLCILFIICFVNTCVYHRITHMSDDELEWIANRHEGERMYFKSQYADTDTLTVLEVCIRNSLNPINWGHYNTSNKEYTAHGHVRYGFMNRRDGGILLFRTTDKNTTNSLVSYAWSKKYGLVQYTFQDGTTFTRIDIGNH